MKEREDFSMKFKENKLVGGGGNSLKPSHNRGFSLIGTFNNLALWGENKFVSKLKRTYKFQRGGYCHTEDNSPKYRMVGKIYQCLTNVDKRLRNKCAIVCVGKNILSLGGESGCLNEVNYNHERGLSHELINNEPSHEFLSDKFFSRFTSHFSLKSAAFTLAEVMVTLGIIGVVSAMTVPTLMQNYQRQSYVTQLHKVYNELSQALLRYQTDKNAINFKEAGLSGSEAYTEFQKNYFKVVQDCGTTQTPCFASSYKKMSGSSTNFKCKYGCMSLASGAAIGGYGNGTNGVYEIVVDVNGQKGPNIFGRDAFTMYIYTAQNVIDDLALKNPDDMNDSTWDSESSVPLTQEQREKNFQRACQGDAKAGEWHGCFGKILNDNWQMNY